jgi:hypothetical protein
MKNKILIILTVILTLGFTSCGRIDLTENKIIVISKWQPNPNLAALYEVRIFTDQHKYYSDYKIYINKNFQVGDELDLVVKEKE